MLEAFQKASKAVFNGSLAVTIGCLAAEAASVVALIGQHQLTGHFYEMVHQATYIAAGAGLAAGAVGLLAAAGWGVVEYRKERAERLAHMKALRSRPIPPVTNSP